MDTHFIIGMGGLLGFFTLVFIWAIYSFNRGEERREKHRQ